MLAAVCALQSEPYRIALWLAHKRGDIAVFGRNRLAVEGQQFRSPPPGLRDPRAINLAAQTGPVADWRLWRRWQAGCRWFSFVGNDCSRPRFCH